MTTQILGFSGEYRFLSNFYPSPIVWNGKTYPSNEHFFQAAKAATEEDHELVRTQTNPTQAKRAGRGVQIRPDWEKIKVDIMTLGLFLKFTQNEHLKERLLATGDAYLEETNHWGDTYWGKVGLEGQNMLGRLLMRLRDTLNEREMSEEDKAEFDRGFNDYHDLSEGP